MLILELPRFWTDLIGMLAGILVMSTFYMNCMVKLRCLAILSNIAFATYGLLLDLWPILVLHVLLLPINTLRLAQLRSARRA